MQRPSGAASCSRRKCCFELCRRFYAAGWFSTSLSCIVFGSNKGILWARLVSNQRPLACEASHGVRVEGHLERYLTSGAKSWFSAFGPIGQCSASFDPTNDPTASLLRRGEAPKIRSARPPPPRGSRLPRSRTRSFVGSLGTTKPSVARRGGGGGRSSRTTRVDDPARRGGASAPHRRCLSQMPTGSRSVSGGRRSSRRCNSPTRRRRAASRHNNGAA